MDSGWIVAGTSIATIAATGFFSLRAKRIDAEQKLNEHKMSIRSLYITNKIQAGQKISGKISAIKYGVAIELLALEHLSSSQVLNARLLGNAETLVDTIALHSAELDDFTSIFYDLGNNITELSLILFRLVRARKYFTTVVTIAGEKDDVPVEVLNEIKEISADLIKLCNMCMESCNSVSESIRHELAQYDLL